VKDAIGIHQCKSCKFFHTPGTMKEVGVCVRFPPTPFIMGMAPASPLVDPTKPQQARPIIHAYYPMVEEASGCGEHQSNQAAMRLAS